MAEMYADLKKKARNEQKRNVMQQRLQQMAGQEQQRRAFDLDKERKGYDRKAYSLDQTEADAELISFALSEESVFQLSEEEKARLEMRQGRNLSHILLNNKRFFGDSEQMTQVKQAIQALETHLVTLRDATKPMKYFEISRTEDLYMKAIEQCQEYLDSKTTHTRSDRHQMVQDRMNNLITELATISTIKLKIQNDPSLGEGLDSPYGLLLLAKMDEVYHFSGGKEGDEPQEQEKPEFREKDLENVLDDADPPAQQIINLLLMRSVPQQYAKKAGDDGANITMFLYNLLQSFPTGEHVEYLHSAVVGFKGEGYNRKMKVPERNKKGKIVEVSHVCNTMVQLSQDKSGNLLVKVGKHRVHLPYKKEMILDQMQSNLIDCEEIFGQKFTNDSVSWIREADPDGENMAALRNTCLRVLSKRAHVKPSDFNNISTKEIQRMAVYMIDGLMDEANIKDYMRTIEGTVEVTREWKDADGFEVIDENGEVVNQVVVKTTQ